MAKLLYTYEKPSSARDLKEACLILRNGGTIAYPTDVNWAFGCDPLSKKALERIRLLKPFHPSEQPFSLLCNSISMIASIADVDQVAFRVLRRIFPGPYTVILNRNRSFPKHMKDKRMQVGVRIPDSALILDLIKTFGQPLATTSVPYQLTEGKYKDRLLHFGYEVDEIYGHGLDLILDLGQAVPAKETTIIDFSKGEPEVLRQGHGSVDDLFD